MPDDPSSQYVDVSETNVALQIRPPNPSKPKLTRASASKTRSGCITCKKRHVKCDEAKPSCNRCLASRGFCEGYAVGSGKKKPGPGQLSWDSKKPVTEPSPIVQSRPTSHSQSPRIQLQLEACPSAWQDDWGMLYFQEFIDLVRGPWTTAASSGDLWSITIPQLTRNNHTLQHAAIAIGALSMWHRQLTDRSLHAVSAPKVSAPESETHYLQAVSYYCRALKLQSPEASAQDTVFLSLLFLFFETLRGDRGAALDHVNHGLALLFTILTDQDSHHQVANFAPQPKPLLGAVADLFTALGAQARTIFRGRIGHGHSLPHFQKALKDKEQTIDSFMVTLSRLPRSSARVDRIPTKFDNLGEFEEYLLAAKRRQIQLSQVMVEALKASAAMQSEDEDVIKRTYVEILQNSAITEFWEDTRRMRQQLESAFSPLFDSIVLSDNGSPSFLRAIHLRLKFLTIFVLDDPLPFQDVDALSQRTPYFREFISLVEVALRAIRRQSNNPAHQVALQCGLAWYLMVTACLCRDALVRDEAVRLLKDYPGHDGLWDTRALYAMAKRNLFVEQVNSVEGTPAEQLKRLWHREFLFEESGARVLLRYLDKDTTTGEWQIVEEVAQILQESEETRWEKQTPTRSFTLLKRELFAT